MEFSQESSRSLKNDSHNRLHLSRLHIQVKKSKKSIKEKVKEWIFQSLNLIEKMT